MQNGTIISLKSTIDLMIQKIKNLEERMLHNDINNIEMKDTIVQQQPSSKPLYSDLFKSKETEKMNFEIKNIYNIQQDLFAREKKINNIIIYGLNMDKLQNNEINHDSDKSKIDNLLRVAEVDMSKIIKYKRLINKNNESNNPPILIEFNNINDKVKLLKKSSLLRKNKEYEKVYINEDLTTAQRIINKELLQLRNELNSHDNTKDLNVNYYFTIRNGKVVKKLKTL